MPDQCPRTCSGVLVGVGPDLLSVALDAPTGRRTRETQWHMESMTHGRIGFSPTCHGHTEAWLFPAVTSGKNEPYSPAQKEEKKYRTRPKRSTHVTLMPIPWIRLPAASEFELLPSSFALAPSLACIQPTTLTARARLFLFNSVRYLRANQTTHQLLPSFP